MCSPQTILDKIVEKIVDTVIQSLVCHIRFVTCYKGNLEKLDAEKKNLEDQWQKVNEEVEKNKTLGEDIEANVSNWLTEADKMIKEVEEFVNHKTDKESMQCFKFSCPDYISRYKLSKEAERKIGDIKNLTQKGKFDKVSRPKPPPPELLLSSSAELVSMDYMSFDSRESVFNRIMDALKDLNACKIGVHGPGGVGKTKMVEEVSKQVEKEGLFDEVVMAVVSQDANVSKIQLQLVGGLNPKPDVVTITDDHERAKKLWQRLDNGKKNLIILDDIWHELNLTTIGIPIKERNKVVITSRNRDVLKNMEIDTEIQIKVLSETEAWDLFKKKVGNSVDSPKLHDTAKKVCKECQGLPVAILVVGGALKGKEKYVWKNALEKLKKSMLKKIEGIDPKLYNSLKLSYDQLSMDAKSCFLLCCMFPEDAEIPIDELVRHCKARRLLAEKQDTLEKTRDAVRTIVDSLKTCSLLLDDTNKNVVKMHDVIRDVAVSIADDEKAILVKYGVHEWPEKGTYESYLAISLRSKTVDEVPNKLGCSQLHTLLLECIDPSVIIPGMFFDGMEKLTVLELNGVCMLQLPPSLGNLVNLRMLCLNKCQLEDITILKDLKNNLEVLSLRGSDIKALPSEIGQLTQLRLLDLRNCRKLSKIPRGVISNLSRLEELYILGSFKQWEDATTNKERSNVSLDELRKLTQLTTLHIHIPNAMLLPKDIHFENLIRFIISMGESFDSFEYQSSTRMFKLVGVPFRDEFNVLLERAEVLHLEKVEGLQKVYHGLYPSCARGLLQIQRLVIKDCEVMEGIFGNEGEKNEAAVTSEAINFSQLKSMKLESLPSLVNFYPKMEKTTTVNENSSTQVQSLFNEKVTFPALEELYIDGLPKLTEIWHRKLLPLESFKELRDVTIVSCEKLVNVGSSNMHRQLPKLKKLFVLGCQELKVVVLENGEEEEKAKKNTSTISFPHLTNLTLLNLNSVKSFCTSRFETQSLFTSQVTFPALEKLYIDGLPKLTEIWDRKLLPLESFKELRDVTIKSCEKLANVGSSNMHQQLPKLKQLDVWGCQELKVVVLENGEEEEKAENKTSTISFPHLTKLTLLILNSVKSFCTSRSETQSLFTSQVTFPALEELYIDGLPKLTEIWHRKLLPLESFKELRDVTIVSCEKLANVGSSNMHRQLPKLKKLFVRGCQQLKVVVLENGEEEEKAEKNTSTISFPHLTRLTLRNLNSVNSFCTSRSETQSLFTSQATFPALEELYIDGLPKLTEIWHRKLLPLESFKELRDVTIVSCEKLANVGSSNMHRQLPKLKKLFVRGCQQLKVVVLENGEEEEKAEKNTSTISFPHLTRLTLRNLNSVNSFCTSRSETQSLFTSQATFPALEELYIDGLPKLTEIWHRKLLPLESFKELRDVTIVSCEKLANVGSSNMHRQLPKLKKLFVRGCQQLKVVVLENGEEEEKAEKNTSTISFPHLTRLTLRNLNSVNSFCTSRSETQSLFTSQVTFPALEELYIDGLPKLTEIWHRKLLPLETFKELRDVTIVSCEKLVTVGSSNMHQQLPKLKQLDVQACQELKVVVLENGEEEEKAEKNTSTISFPHLTKLTLRNLNSVKSFCTFRSETQSLFTSQVTFPALEKLSIDGLSKLTEIWHRKLLLLESFKELREVTIVSCEKLVTVGSSNMHRQLPKLKQLDVQACQELKVVVLENGEEEEKAEKNTSTISFPHLTRLTLLNLNSVKSFCTSRFEAQSLFTSQVTFPALEKLYIDGLPKLIEIWDRKLLPLEPFKELRDVTIKRCEKLVNVGSSNMHRQLPKLKQLDVRGCQELKVVVLENGAEEEKAENNTSTISFPHLTRLTLVNLKSLNSFCTSRSETQSLFTSQVTFPALEELYIDGLPKLTEIWDRKLLPLESFKELRDVTIWSCEKLVNVGSSNMDRQLPKLKQLVVQRCQCENIYIVYTVY